MKFGMPNKLRKLYDNLEAIDNCLGKYKFAWYPRSMADGTYIWLEKYFEVKNADINFNADNRSYRINNEYYDINAYRNRAAAKYYVMLVENTHAGYYNRDERYAFGDEAVNILIEIRADILASINQY